MIDRVLESRLIDSGGGGTKGPGPGGGGGKQVSGRRG
jgi:hypothetical protein